jgi:hypothetical protein
VRIATASVEVNCRYKILSERDARHRDAHEKPGWRNWQTQKTQNLPVARPWGFDSLSGHQNSSQIFLEFFSAGPQQR